MTKETTIHRERAALLAVYEADALAQKLCEASQVIIRDMPPRVPAVHALCPTKPAPAPHPAQRPSEIKGSEVVEAGRALYLSGDSPGPMQILRPDGEQPRTAAQGLISAARNLFKRNALGLRRHQSTLNRRREWSTRDKILLALGQKWGKR